MSKVRLRRGWLALGLIAAASLGATATSAQAAPDPLFVFVPKSSDLGFVPPPFGFFEGPCGMGVDSAGRFYVSDYYHDTVDVYDQNANYTTPPPPGKPPTGATGYLGQLAAIDPLDGPCGLAFDATNNLYVNDYHRAVIRYGALGAFGAGTTITGATTPEETHPTGVAVDPATGNVYVDQRTYVSVFDSSGAPVMDGSEPLHIGAGSLQDGYGIAFSQFPGTEGRLYVPDAATNTVRVYDPSVSKANPVEEIDGSETPNGQFVSLRDASVVVDRVSGETYVIDNLQPQYTERPQALAYVFDSTGTYEGHLKFAVTDALPVGLAVDNSKTATQGRVYLTSGNSSVGAIYAYGPDSATTAPLGASSARLALASLGSGEGTIQSSLRDEGCSDACEEELPAGASVALSAEPGPGSAFAGWSGACEGSQPSCTIELEQAASVRAAFRDLTAPASSSASSAAPIAAGAPVATLHRRVHHHKPKHRRTRPSKRHRVGRAR